MRSETGIDRLTIRERPSGLPLMYQSWQKLLFMHWELPPEALRPHLPDRLSIDTYEGKAWIGVTPFVVRNARPSITPPIPGLSSFNEVNVRTYVHFEGVPGVWFFSLDADSVVSVVGASATYHLPYRLAQMRFKEEEDYIFFKSKRVIAPETPVTLEARWVKGGMLGEPQPGTLEFFLVERYCLYAEHDRDLYRARIFHPPWKLQSAELTKCDCTMIAGQALPMPQGQPLLHYSEKQDTGIWPIKKVT